MSKTFIEAMPKVELHIHLEGSIAPKTLLELAKRNGIQLGHQDEASLQEFYRYKNFLGFIDVFVACVSCLKTPADIYQIAHELLEDSARQNVLYREVFFSPQHYIRPELSYLAILEALDAARADARREWGVEVRWLLDISREMGVPAAELATERAIAGMSHGIIGLGIGGDEANFPPAWFAPCFAKAKAAGLRLTAHAGEAAGPESIWGALDDLKAERIGHGVRVVEDEALLARVLAERIPLEMCPTSNVLTRVVESFADHPLPALLARGFHVTVNSDDPPMFNTNLTHELAQLASVFGLDHAALKQLSENAIQASFLPDSEKRELAQRFEAAWLNAEKVQVPS
jgi:adenosine deaminase